MATTTDTMKKEAKKHVNERDVDDIAAEIDNLRNDLQGLSNSVGRMAKRQINTAQDKVYETAYEAEEAIRRNPLSAVAIAVGMGFLFGLLTRRG